MNKPELMRMIADAMEKDPKEWWRGFEFQSLDKKWCGHSDETDVFDSLHGGFPVRPRPRTITINVEVPEPMKNEPIDGSEYWFIDTSVGQSVCDGTWYGSVAGKNRFNRGIWPTEHEAQQAADAIFGALGRKS